MKDNKKKTLVLIALAVVILAVGAFQFVAGGSSKPAPAPVAKKEEPKQPVAEAPKADAPKNPLLAADLPARDPFQAEALAMQVNPTPPQPTPPPKQESRPPRLPNLEINKTGAFSGNIPVNVQAIPEPEFGFSLGGVMLGNRPMAVFKDGQGHERLVMLGGSLDPESKVISIDKDAVTVRFHGKTIKLTVEGNPNAK